MMRLSRLTGVVLMVLVIAVGFGLARVGAETVKFTYDERGRLTSATYGSSGRIQYKYDAAGNIATVEESLIVGAGAASQADDANSQEPFPPQSMASLTAAGTTTPVFRDSH